MTLFSSQDVLLEERVADAEVVVYVSAACVYAIHKITPNKSRSFFILLKISVFGLKL